MCGPVGDVAVTSSHSADGLSCDGSYMCVAL